MRRWFPNVSNIAFLRKSFTVEQFFAEVEKHFETVPSGTKMTPMCLAETFTPPLLHTIGSIWHLADGGGDEAAGVTDRKFGDDKPDLVPEL